MNKSPMMKRSNNKIGSALAAFENNISKNQQLGSAAGNSSFITGVASSPRKFRIRNRSQESSCPLAEEDESDSRDAVSPKPKADLDNSTSSRGSKSSVLSPISTEVSSSKSKRSLRIPAVKASQENGSKGTISKPTLHSNATKVATSPSKAGTSSTVKSKSQKTDERSSVDRQSAASNDVTPVLRRRFGPLSPQSSSVTISARPATGTKASLQVRGARVKASDIPAFRSTAEPRITLEKTENLVPATPEFRKESLSRSSFGASPASKQFRDSCPVPVSRSSLTTAAKSPSASSSVAFKNASAVAPSMSNPSAYPSTSSIQSKVDSDCVPASSGLSSKWKINPSTSSNLAAGSEGTLKVSLTASVLSGGKISPSHDNNEETFVTEESTSLEETKTAGADKSEGGRRQYRSRTDIADDTRAPTPIRPSMRRNSFDEVINSPQSRRRIGVKLSTPNARRATSVSPARATTDRSPSRRAQSAIRNAVGMLPLGGTSAPMAPQRKISDPDKLPTSGIPVASRAAAFEHASSKKQSPKEQQQKKAPKKRQNRIIASRMGAFDAETKRQRELELRVEAQKYNPADHGLRGILIWNPRKERQKRRIRWAETLTVHRRVVTGNRSSRRSSLDFTLGSSSSSSPKHPRRNSLTALDELEGPPQFLVKQPKSRGTTLLLAAFRASLWLSGIKFRKFRAACQLQAMFRRWKVRKYLPVFKLEHELRCVERRRLEDLKRVQSEKWKQMERTRDQGDATLKRQASRADKCQERIRSLREENIKLEMKNTNLQSKSSILQRMNDQVKSSTDLLLGNVTSLSIALGVLKDRCTQLSEECGKLESSLQDANEKIHDTDRMHRHEQHVRERMDEVVQKMVVTIQLRCNDATLVHEVTTLHTVLLAEERLRSEIPEGTGMDTSDSSNGDYDSMASVTLTGGSDHTFSVISNAVARRARSGGSFRSSRSSQASDCSSFAAMDDDDLMTTGTADSLGLEQ